MKIMLLGDGEVEANVDHILQLAMEICKEDVIALFFHKLSLLGWEVSDYDTISHLFSGGGVFDPFACK